MGAERAEGRAEGLREGEAKGREQGEAKGLRVAIADLCDLLGLPLDDARRAELDAADLPALEALRAELKRSRRWPELG